MPNTTAVPTKHKTVPKKESTGGNRSVAGVRRDHILAAAPPSLVPSTATPQVKKRIKGREGYDCHSALNPEPRSSYDDMAPSEILHVLRIPPDHTINQGFIIPGVATDPGASIESLKNTAIAVIDYKLVGNPFKTRPNPRWRRITFPPVSTFRPDWRSSSRVDREKKRVVTEMRDEETILGTDGHRSASARWREQTIVEKKKGKDVKVWTKGSLQPKEQNDYDSSQVGNCTCLFPETSTDALKAWWGRTCATRGEDATTQQGMSTTDRGGVVSSGV
jgi:hypothetical protein